MKPLLPAAFSIVLAAAAPSQQPTPAERAARFPQMSKAAEAAGLAEPFRGITAGGAVVPGLFPIRSTGVSTEPVRRAAEAFLAVLTADQRARTVFPVDDPEWRKWMNQHFYVRQGVSFEEMTEAQREAAIGLMRASLSAKGLALSRDIMRLNHTLGELNGDNFTEYGAKSGKFAGTTILQEERRQGLALVHALTPEQRAKAIRGHTALLSALLAGLAGRGYTTSQRVPCPASRPPRRAPRTAPARIAPRKLDSLGTMVP